MEPASPEPFETIEGGAYVYVLTNSAFNRHVKIGFTSRSPNERAKELSAATGVPSQYEVRHGWFVPADQAQAIEREVHLKLKAQGRHHRKEFFRINPAEAASVIEAVLQRRGLLDLAREQEAYKSAQLDAYYAEKQERQADQERSAAARNRQQQIASQVELFRITLWSCVIERHPIQAQAVPVAAASILAVLAAAVTLEMHAPWIVVAIAVVGTVVLGYESVQDWTVHRVRARYKALVDERLTQALGHMSASPESPSQFQASEAWKVLLQLPKRLDP